MSATTDSTRRLRPSRLGLVLFLAVAITGSGALPFAVAANSLRSGRALELAMAAMRLLPNATPNADNWLGTDGRFTILLMGSDFRTNKPGNGDRNDMIMVLTINPTTGRMATASIPRDTAYIPRDPSNGGGTYQGRVNELWKKYAPSGRNVAIEKLRKDIAFALGVQIDHAAFLRFDGFDALMDELGPITVPTTRPAKDPKLIDTGNPVGVYFPTASNWVLVGSPTTQYPRCSGWWWHSPNATSNPGYECHRALMYARTRKGSKNSDFKRQARGVDIVLAAMAKADAGNYGSGRQADFVTRASNQVANNPWRLTMSQYVQPNATTASGLYTLIQAANFSNVNRVVFSPTTYSSHISGTSTYKMNVTKVRNWIDVNFQNI